MIGLLIFVFFNYFFLIKAETDQIQLVSVLCEYIRGVYSEKSAFFDANKCLKTLRNRFENLLQIIVA